MKSLRNAIITSSNRHFSEMGANNWEHEREGGVFVNGEGVGQHQLMLTPMSALASNFLLLN